MSALDRLAEVARRRRHELLMTQAEVAKRAGIAQRTIKRIEEGEPVREINLFKLDRGLDWRPGSAEGVLAGGDPVELQDQHSLEQQLRDLRASVSQVRMSGRRRTELETTIDAIEAELRSRAGRDQAG